MKSWRCATCRPRVFFGFVSPWRLSRTTSSSSAMFLRGIRTTVGMGATSRRANRPRSCGRRFPLGAFGKPNAGIRGDQPDTLQSAFLEMLEERAPARFILLRPLANAENLPITALVHADRNQQRDVAHLAGPTALEHDAVEINIRMVALDRTVAPGLDRPIDLLVEVRHRRGRHPRAPQCLGDVLDPAHRYPGQIHLDQRL